MNSNLIGYRIGRRILVKRNDWESTLIEVEILEKAYGAVKVKVLSEGWWKLGELIWLSTNMNAKEFWYVEASVGWAD